MEMYYQAKYRDAKNNMYIGITKAKYKSSDDAVYVLAYYDTENVSDPIAFTEEEFSKLTFVSY